MCLHAARNLQSVVTYTNISRSEIPWSLTDIVVERSVYPAQVHERASNQGDGSLHRKYRENVEQWRISALYTK